MSIRVRLKVKFRALGITFGSIDRVFAVKLPTYVAEVFLFSERGITLSIATTSDAEG